MLSARDIRADSQGAFVSPKRNPLFSSATSIHRSPHLSPLQQEFDSAATLITVPVRRAAIREATDRGRDLYLRTSWPGDRLLSGLVTCSRVYQGPADGRRASFLPPR